MSRTYRTTFDVPERHRAVVLAALRSPDFTRLTCPEARRRVCELANKGLSDGTIACLTGWDAELVRHAIAGTNMRRGGRA